MAEPFCKNCLLYNFEKRHCSVVVIHEGTRMNPPTEPEDHCIFEDQYRSINDDKKVEIWSPEVQQVRMWVEDPVTGKPAENGVVKIEYPVGFFCEAE